ncbi:MAG: GntR family transcriptional regulator [Sciscionella sp.]
MMQLSLDIDRSSPVPLYFQLAQQLEQQIEAGELPPGTRLGNEIQLAGELGLSRLTLRRAIGNLVDKGMLVRKRGVGTQVVHNQVKRPVELTSLYDDLAQSGQQPATTVLTHELVAAPDEVAAALGAETDAEVLHLERLRLSAGQPLALLRNWLPADLTGITVEALESRGLYSLLRAAGVHIRVARQRIGARRATTRESSLMADRRGSAVLTMQRTAYDDSGAAVEFAQHVYRADRYSFESTLVERQ